jgi:hypothetical protein
MTETTLSRNTTKKWGKWSHRLLETIENADSPTYKDGIFFKDDDIIVIFDKYPKSKYHFLCLPRKLRIDEPQSLSREHVEILTKMLDKGKYVEKEYCFYRKSLLQTRTQKRILILAYFFRIKRKNPQDISLPFRFGFHAKPSMRSSPTLLRLFHVILPVLAFTESFRLQATSYAHHKSIRISVGGVSKL